MSELEREGTPWMPEETLLVMLDELPPDAVEAFEAIRELRRAAIQVVTDFAAGHDVRVAIAGLEEALLAGVHPEGEE